MKKHIFLLLVFLIAFTGDSDATDSKRRLNQMEYYGSSQDRAVLTDDGDLFTRDDPDSVFFGGDDGTGNAFIGGIWDWDTIVSDPFQGWTSSDATENPGDYFSRVTADDFVAGNDPCSPMINGTVGQIWVGIHESEANLRDFIAGMGYQNNMCQSAFSPMLSIDPLVDELGLTFTYFVDSETEFDYTFVYIRCYDGSGTLLPEEGEYEMDHLDGRQGTYQAPVEFDEAVSAGILPAATEQIKLEFRMNADGLASDQDGDWDSTCGPFAADDITVLIGTTPYAYDFDADEQGWTFARCPGIGAFMAISDPADYVGWLADLDLQCECALDEYGLQFCDMDNSPFDPPGHPVGYEEVALSGKVARGIYQPPAYNLALCTWTDFTYMPQDRGTFYRPGYRYYPYTSEVNPIPHWSPRMGQDTWWHSGDDPACGQNLYNLSTVQGLAGDPMPAAWDSMQIVYELTTSSVSFGHDPTPDEGNNQGTPILDDFQFILTGSPDAPVISFGEAGSSWMDGFGQNYPHYLEPSDPGNVNISRDLSGSNDLDENDWLGDSATISGPNVSSSDPLTQWQVELCFMITHVGPRQNSSPEYLAWKNRLTGDPETEYVCVLMDSLETTQGAFANKYVTYFHEDDPGFIPGDELGETNEILPDGVFTPGTRFIYYYASSWVHVPDSEIYEFPPGRREFEILPRMRLADGDDYSVIWPSFFYVDAFNRGVEFYVDPTMDLLNIEYDKYDYLNSSSNYKTPLARSYCATGGYNPGGYGNNGCTVEQLLGYRMIFVNTGTFGVSAMEGSDWTLFSQWLGNTDCDLPTVRRGIMFDGDMIGVAMSQEAHAPYGRNFLNDILGATLVADAYRDYAHDDEFCVYLEEAPGAAYSKIGDTSVFGNGCPTEFSFNVYGVQGGIDGAVGNMVFSQDVDTEFSQVVRENHAYPNRWKSIINGFSVHHLSMVGCDGGECSADSSCIVNGAANVLLPAISWVLDNEDPYNPIDTFDPWLYPCTNTGVDDEPISHSSINVNFLRGASPNPFRNSATIRFSLASAGEVDFSIYDVSGRLVKSMGENEYAAGDNSIVWDGTTNSGDRVSGGIFWMQMNTADGFSSGKKMIVLR